MMVAETPEANGTDFTIVEDSVFDTSQVIMSIYHTEI